MRICSYEHVELILFFHFLLRINKQGDNNLSEILNALADDIKVTNFVANIKK